MIVVAKIGTTSVTRSDGLVNAEAVARLADDVMALRSAGHDVVVVSSGAVTAGVAALSPEEGRPTDTTTLQALSAIGQHRLMRVYDDALAARGLLVGQVLVVPSDFGDRRRYLVARATLQRLLALGVVPIVNENDALADDEIRFGDNDRIVALVANLIGAEVVVLLTDTDGLYDADPRTSANATLVEEVRAIDEELGRVALGPIRAGSRGGMAAKLAAARMASWSGVRVVIASAERPHVLVDAVAGAPGVGTVFRPAERRLPARKLWLAFALQPAGRVVVDAGARDALRAHDASLLPAGVIAILEGTFGPEDAIEIAGPDGVVFAKGISRLDARRAGEWAGRRSGELAPDLSAELVHRDDLVVLDGALARDASALS